MSQLHAQGGWASPPDPPQFPEPLQEGVEECAALQSPSLPRPRRVFLRLGASPDDSLRIEIQIEPQYEPEASLAFLDMCERGAGGAVDVVRGFYIEAAISGAEAAPVTASSGMITRGGWQPSALVCGALTTAGADRTRFRLHLRPPPPSHGVFGCVTSGTTALLRAALTSVRLTMSGGIVGEELTAEGLGARGWRVGHGGSLCRDGAANQAGGMVEKIRGPWSKEEYRLAPNGKSYTFEEFADLFGVGVIEQWNIAVRRRPRLPVQAKDGGNGSEKEEAKKAKQAKDGGAEEEEEQKHTQSRDKGDAPEETRAKKRRFK
eukprot:Hpha_TRINITY_DN11837_c0_g1::TRINITY_DN11837_c0_g1_i1::g.1851::m.1851